MAWERVHVWTRGLGAGGIIGDSVVWKRGFGPDGDGSEAAD